LIQRSHGVANGCYVISVNRTGHEGEDPEGGIEFWGQSFVSDPSGTIIAKASVDTPEIVTAEIDLARLDVQRTHWPFLRDRRIDAYGEITKRYIDE
jgi:N-carbamoylputrescine amidase